MEPTLPHTIYNNEDAFRHSNVRVPLYLVPHHTLLHTVLCEQGIGRAEQKAKTQKHTAAYVVYFLCPFGAAQVKLGSKQRGSKIPEDPAQRRLGRSPSPSND